jgi:3-hydroxymyristoyl/3-hydroxydecanoyl-(acyl carrier protein) dehydratase
MGELIDTANTRPISITFDKIIGCVPGEYITAEKRITRSAPYFPDHFPKKPVLPMTVLLECIQNLARQFVAYCPVGYQIIELRKIKMNEFVQPGDVLVCYMKVKQQSDDEIVLACRNEVNGKRVCVVEVVLRKQLSI